MSSTDDGESRKEHKEQSLSSLGRENEAADEGEVCDSNLKELQQSSILKPSGQKVGVSKLGNRIGFRREEPSLRVQLSVSESELNRAEEPVDTGFETEVKSLFQKVVDQLSQTFTGPSETQIYSRKSSEYKIQIESSSECSVSSAAETEPEIEPSSAAASLKGSVQQLAGLPSELAESPEEDRESDSNASEELEESESCETVSDLSEIHIESKSEVLHKSNMCIRLFLIGFCLFLLCMILLMN